MAALPDTRRHANLSVQQDLRSVTPLGLEPKTYGLKVSTSSPNEPRLNDDKASTYNDASVTPLPGAQQKAQHFDPELAEVIELWQTLTASQREAILAICRTRD